jgi:hypothetical protein
MLGTVGNFIFDHADKALPAAYVLAYTSGVGKLIVLRDVVITVAAVQAMKKTINFVGQKWIPDCLIDAYREKWKEDISGSARWSAYWLGMKIAQICVTGLTPPKITLVLLACGLFSLKKVWSTSRVLNVLNPAMISGDWSRENHILSEKGLSVELYRAVSKAVTVRFVNTPNRLQTKLDAMQKEAVQIEDKTIYVSKSFIKNIDSIPITIELETEAKRIGQKNKGIQKVQALYRELEKLCAPDVILKVMNVLDDSFTAEGFAVVDARAKAAMCAYPDWQYRLLPSREMGVSIEKVVKYGDSHIEISSTHSILLRVPCLSRGVFKITHFLGITDPSDFSTKVNILPFGGLI